MPGRTVPLITGEYYHIYNRGINKQPIFLGTRDFDRIMLLLEFYSFDRPKLRFSKYKQLSQKDRKIFFDQLNKKHKKLIEVISFCFMPNHFHLLIRQLKDNGISRFAGILQNSYTRYFNVKHKKIGPLLQGQFKAIRVEDDNQLLHLSRYIHLNPYTSFIVKELNELKSYQWSSFMEYINGENSGLCNKEIILSSFKHSKEYERFVFDQALYQRELGRIKHLSLED